jgi:hypothetical protein
MAESKIYVVECGEGEWDDHVSWVERAFRIVCSERGTTPLGALNPT